MTLRTHITGERLAASVLGLVLLLCTNPRVDAQVPNNTAPNQAASGSGCAAFDGNGEVQRMLLAELRKLRMELLEYRIETQTNRVSALQLSLSQTQARRQRLADEERVAVQQPNIPEPQFPGPMLTPAERTQLESLRSAAIAEQAGRIRSEQSDLAARESADADALRAEQQRLQSLQASLTELTRNR
jgi:hypothetical protein